MKAVLKGVQQYVEVENDKVFLRFYMHLSERVLRICTKKVDETSNWSGIYRRNGSALLSMS